MDLPHPAANGTDPAPDAIAETPAPRSKPFRKKFSSVRLAPDIAERQGRITTHAFLALGRDAALALLNTPHPALGGRPLDLAMASDEGERAVQALIAEAVALRTQGQA